jgi:hypothetical protein
MSASRSFFALGAVALSAIVSQACGSKNSLSGFSPDGGPQDASAASDALASSSSGSSSGTSPPGGFGDGSFELDGPRTSGDDFPNPIIDGGAPSSAPTLFGAPDQGTTGPCLYEPEVGSLFPNNWLPLRFRFTTSHSETLFEITLTIPNEKHPLVIYTTQSGYTLTPTVWQLIVEAAAGAGPIHVTVRSGVASGGMLTGGPWKGSEGDIEIAPVSAGGSIVYWTTTSTANVSSTGTVLKGFHIGDSSVQPVLTTVQEGNGSGCIACHTSTPDGLFVGLTTDPDPANGTGQASIDLRSVDGQAKQPSFLTPSALALLARENQHAPAFTKAHWTTGDHLMLSMLNPGGAPAGKTGPSDIVWTNLEAKGQVMGTDWGVVARNGDSKYAASAQFSHDGKTIVYTSSTSVDSGMNGPDGLIYTVPFNGGMGGAATPLPGASDSNYIQYYPVFSVDDQFVAMNRVPTTAVANTYNNPSAEIFVVPSKGGTATRLLANDPPACVGVTSPGITNSWAKWSPEAKTVDGKTYYFLVFSSGRDPNAVDPTTLAGGYPQLYVAPIVVDASGQITSYSALYFRNQVETEHNHTAAWDVFMIPPQPPQ